MAAALIPRDLVCKDPTALREKIARFKAAGVDALHAVFDFDRTLTTYRLGASGHATTWGILKEHLPPAGKDRYQELFEHYRTFELNDTMSQAQAVTWSSQVLDLYVQYEVNLFEAEQDLLKNVTIRPQAKQLFEVCAAYGIPTIILSAGIKNIIELWMRAHGIRPDIIHSTALELDSQGVIRGWDAASLVHMLNKKEESGKHDEIMAIRSRRPMTILMGDSLKDVAMAEGTETVLRVLIHDLRADEAMDIRAARERGLGLFDAMIETGSLQPVRHLIETIAS